MIIFQLVHQFPEKSMSWKGPILEHFHWRRIVVDEAHSVFNEFFNGMYVLRTLIVVLICFIDTFSYYTYDYAWYVSGTPFPPVNASRY